MFYKKFAKEYNIYFNLINNIERGNCEEVTHQKTPTLNSPIGVSDLHLVP